MEGNQLIAQIRRDLKRRHQALLESYCSVSAPIDLGKLQGRQQECEHFMNSIDEAIKRFNVEYEAGEQTMADSKVVTIHRPVRRVPSSRTRRKGGDHE